MGISYPAVFCWWWRGSVLRALFIYQKRNESLVSLTQVLDANKLKKNISDSQQPTRVGDHLSWNINDIKYTFKEVY